jgi:hypothetical protein
VLTDRSVLRNKRLERSMKHTYLRYAGTLILIPTLMAGAAMAGQTSAETRGTSVQPVQAAPVSEQDAAETRERLNRVFEQFPPSLKQILQLDPLLLNDRQYLAPYPALNQFLAQHPEIAHNPSYFVGTSYSPRITDPRQRSMEIWSNIVEVFAAFLAALTAIGVFGWLLKTLIDYRRWHRASKVQAEAHSKLLERFTTNEDLMAYIQTPAGQKFLNSAPIPIDLGPRAITAPIGRILWSVQAGLVLMCSGVGLHYAVPANMIDELGAEPLYVIGTLAVAIGAGFVISAAVSYVISQRLGLFEQSTREAPSQL